MNSYLMRSAVVAALGGLLFGFDTAVIAGTTRALSDVFSLTPGMLGITVSAALWGTVLGSIVAEYFFDLSIVSGGADENCLDPEEDTDAP